MAAVAALWRYPVKSAAGEPLAEAVLAAGGVAGDRGWGVLADDGTVVSAKDPARGGPLLDVRVRTDGAATVLALPDGAAVVAGTAAADEALSVLLDVRVALSREVPAGLSLWRRWPAAEVLADWMPDAVPGARARTEVRSGTFRDFGAVHLVTTAGLDALAARTGGLVDPLRFRPNVVLDGPEPRSGDELEVGDAVLRVVLPTPRCVVPALAGGDVAADARVLPALARHARVQVADLGRAACFGWYADVVRPGRVRVGAEVRHVPLEQDGAPGG